MLLKKDLSQCKDLRTVEHLAQQFGWYAAAWTPQEPHLICSDEQFTEFAKALGKLAVTQEGENLLYFLALAAETAQERKNRMDRILERKLFYETSTVITEADIARCHNDQLATPPGVRKADAMETLHFLAPPEEEKQDDTAPNGIVSISAKDLQDKEFKPIKWVVEGLLPQGLALLVAPPKYGKSWLMLDLCLSVASGQKFLDMPTNKTDCLYLALEDNQRRLQDRAHRRGPDGAGRKPRRRDEKPHGNGRQQVFQQVSPPEKRQPPQREIDQRENDPRVESRYGQQVRQPAPGVRRAEFGRDAAPLARRHVSTTAAAPALIGSRESISTALRCRPACRPGSRSRSVRSAIHRVPA